MHFKMAFFNLMILYSRLYFYTFQLIYESMHFQNANCSPFFNAKIHFLFVIINCENNFNKFKYIEKRSGK